MKLTRTIYADRDGMISRLQVEQVQAKANAALASIPRYRREYWKGRVEGLEMAIRLLQDWAGETEPETGTVVTCVCGYGPTTEEDLDEHILASMHLPGNHIARH